LLSPVNPKSDAKKCDRIAIGAILRLDDDENRAGPLAYKAESLELGYVEGQNLLIEWRFDDRVDRLAALATELAGLKPDVIVANGTQAAQAAQQVTKSIPIVMVASNPIGNGLVESLASWGQYYRTKFTDAGAERKTA
jgi:ABC-type Fe3+-hydroxamate transport system substrate-binding protein